MALDGLGGESMGTILRAAVVATGGGTSIDYLNEPWGIGTPNPLPYTANDTGAELAYPPTELPTGELPDCPAIALATYFHQFTWPPTF